ncbi:hypothetical protein ACDP63_12700 [Paracoccus sp. P2]|uniref:Uncharacterized protein n=2 Tax=Paracoccus pantotrophus TaxID=82367 RepID=A0A7H9C0V2_PARPN|nr:hypothetical protein [Paracoccus pantotrophus]MDF3855880.1 hypothetical protein [Paracoccus pantotrophus]QLH15681.1 hypothetical protein HYQ43_16095 [Paracoccus pantotrophus]RDE00826.1 hypothetical protein DTW92_02360 [Paracoccus pantotrophus]RNI20197.1 hypothetical protein EB844_02435 [Paracoccus pantotrophus]WGR63893.1 hypothetical protein E3U24_00550 [Paracoccus pantotrophus]
MKVLQALALIGLLAGPLAAGEAGDLVFAERGPWDLSQGPLVWTLRQTGPEAEGFAPAGAGTVTLAAVPDAADGQPALELTEQTARITRRIGPFPVSGGDPALIFFLETTARDMAALTGGSPFYIRNRLKDALFRGGEVRREGGATVAVFAPFAQDENRGRMAGFDTLELRFTLGDPKRPIRRMQAGTGPLAGGRPAYHSEMVLK